MTNRVVLTTNAITWEAFEGLNNLDESFTGTPNHMGIAWFWNHGFRHYLRDASFSGRRRVHRAFLAAGVEVAGYSEIHIDIVLRVFGGDENARNNLVADIPGIQRWEARLRAMRSERSEITNVSRKNGQSADLRA